MDVNILKGNESFRLSDININAKDFIVSAIESETEKESLEGSHGFVPLETIHKTRIITVPFYFKSIDLLDFPLLRDKMYQKLTTAKPFYIQEMRRPERLSYNFTDTNEKPIYNDKHELYRGKRYFVRIQSITPPEQTGVFGEGEMIFETYELPFAESTGTTLDPRTFDSELWQVGQGLKAEDLKYTHDTSEFQIYNAGDETVDPRQMDLVIKYHGSGNNLKITNHTTGDVWQYNESFTDSTIKLDGIYSYKNDISIFGNTNKKLISIAPGFNDFSVEGTEGSFLISFDFRFYYL